MPAFDEMSFAAALEREILFKLDGDDNTLGLIRTAVNSPNWDALCQARGYILACEDVLRMMVQISRRINGEEAARFDRADRSMN